MVSVPKLWPGETFVCIASGPSLTQEDVDFVRGKARVIVVNDNYKLAPWADVLYAADASWWRRHEGVPSFEGLKYGMPVKSNGHPQPIPYREVRTLNWRQETGLDDHPAYLATGKNSGYQAINLAYHLGASKIVLLGYDMQRGEDGKLHWFGAHPWKLGGIPFAQYRGFFPSLVWPLRAANVEVVNCTRRTALNCFPMRTLEDVFTSVQVAA